MGERKVLNKYLPPDFDPEQLARGVRQIKKRERERKVASNHQIKVRRRPRAACRVPLHLAGNVLANTRLCFVRWSWSGGSPPPQGDGNDGAADTSIERRRQLH